MLRLVYERAIARRHQKILTTALALILFWAFDFGGSARSAQDDTLQPLFAQNRAAMGGSAWDGIAEINDSGTMTTPTGSGAYAQFVDIRSGDSKAFVSIGGYTTIFGYDSSGNWVLDGGQQRTFVTPAALKAARTERYVNRNGWWHPQSDPASFASLGTKQENGKRYDVVVVTPDGGMPVTVWIDSATHLIAKRVTTDGGDVETTHLFGYAAAKGLLFAHTLELVDNQDTRLVKMSVVSVRVLDALVADDTKRFEIPPCLLHADPNQLTCENQIARGSPAAIQYHPLPGAEKRGDPMPFAIAKGPDGALWFTENAANAIGRIATDGTISEYPIPTKDSAPDGIVAALDGALWFTECAAGKIGRITTTGAIREFALPDSGGSAEPRGITVGPSGALWFTWAGQNDTPSKIGRITVDGKVTGYRIPHGWDPRGIAAGSDGALWFAEDGADAIGRVTTNGVVAEYSLTHDSSPDSITTGPDGALWFTEWSGNKIGRITTAGSITEYMVANASGNGHNAGIVAGPDGALWFSRRGDDSGIVRITTGGAIAQHSLDSGTQPAGITVGPDGALWFVATGSVGRLEPEKP
jgi:virginiamycin B lyase